MKISLICDIVLALLFVLIVADGYRKGFIKSLLGLACVLIAAVCASLLTPPVSAWLSDKYVEDAVKDTVSSSIHTVIDDSDSTDKSEGLFSAIDKFVIGDSGAATDKYVSQILDSTLSDDAVDSVSGEIAKTISRPLCNSAAFFIIFIISSLLVRIVASLLDGVFRLPVLKQANKLLGLVFGLLCALIFMMVVSRVFVCMLPWLSGLTDGKIGQDVLNGSHLLSFFSKYNVFKEIIKDISAFI